MKYLAIVLLLLIIARAYAQDKVPPVTDAEKIQILTAERNLSQATDALKSTPQFQAYMSAQGAVSKVGQAVLDSRKITTANYTLCDGPAPVPCADVVKDEIVLRSNKPEPKAPVKK